MKRTTREVMAATVLSLMIALPTAISLQAQTAQKAPDLIGALKATPGVLGVDAGSMMSGKQVIFAWFENKDAVLKWYYSDAHQALMAQFGSARRAKGPLADVPNDGRPVLAIASITLTGPVPTSSADLTSVPQIAIELYAPLPGGLAVGGRFAPSSVRVPGMVEVPARVAAGAQ
jgi:hypothetical protein